MAFGKKGKYLQNSLHFQEGGINGLENAVSHVEDVNTQKTEPVDTVFVRQVTPSGPADRAGLSTGTFLY